MFDLHKDDRRLQLHYFEHLQKKIISKFPSRGYLANTLLFQRQCLGSLQLPPLPDT